VRVEGVEGGRTRIRRGGFATRADAERASARVLALPGPRVVARIWTVWRWLEFWLTLVEDELRPTTVVNYRSIVYLYFSRRAGRGPELGAADGQGIEALLPVPAAVVVEERGVLADALQPVPHRRGAVSSGPAFAVAMALVGGSCRGCDPVAHAGLGAYGPGVAPATLADPTVHPTLPVDPAGTASSWSPTRSSHPDHPARVRTLANHRELNDEVHRRLHARGLTVAGTEIPAIMKG
jgi:hypothetical protein